jgi:hypothetical protein
MKRCICSLVSFVTVCFFISPASHADDTARVVAESKSEKPAAESAYVATSKAMIYSGPSEDYYPTQVLPQGTALEVYHQTDTGWLGIRPPGGSFSWVPASDAYLLPGGKSIEITSKNSVSWIGSSLGTAKQYRWQLRLNVGEQLTKVGEESIKDKDGNERLWYKIAPPNGEFRWIQSGAISRQPPANVTKQKATGDKAVVPASSESTKNDGKKSSKVRPASHQTTQEGFVYEGDVIEGDVIEGEVVDGGYVDGEVIEGDVIYEDDMRDGEYIVAEEVEPHYDANWNDWQLFEFTDQGLRLPFLERAAAWRNTQPDPLCDDPFSLELAPKKMGPMRPGLPTPAAPVSRRRAPWRDPRELSQQRMMGYPQASVERGSGTTFSALRGTLNPSQGGLGSGPGVGPSGYYSPSPNSPSGMGTEPRLAPQIDWSARNSTNSPSLNQSNSLLNNRPSLGNVDMPNLPQDPFGSSAGSSTGGSWTNRNWFGLGQQGSGGTNSGGTNSGGTNGGGTSSGPSGVFGSGLQPTLTAAGNAVQQLQQRLSEMVTRPMQQWNFGELKEKVQYYISNGSSPTERGQARLLLERIDEFERHAMRSGYSLSSVGGSGVSSAGPAVITASYTTPAAPANSGTANSGTMTNHNFDATGWLVPVYAAGPKHPTHALTSDSGQIIAYVTALPGMSLESFVNKAVGVHGLRGYLSEFQAAHIEAQNITCLR